MYIRYFIDRNMLNSIYSSKLLSSDFIHTARFLHLSNVTQASKLQNQKRGLLMRSDYALFSCLSKIITLQMLPSFIETVTQFR